MRMLITGGAGFIGSNFARLALEQWPEAEIVILDLLTYAATRRTLDDILESRRATFVQGDVCLDADVAAAIAGCSHVVHCAAETHVDRAVLDPVPFYRTNIDGTRVLLEAIRRHPVERFIQVSTDEVYGEMPAPEHASEAHPPCPRNPYAVAKATADSYALGHADAFELPIVVSRGTNTYGPYQHPEKLLPLTITQALQGRPIPVYGDGMQIRDWLHVRDHCAALALLLQSGRPGEIYNIGAGNERTNLSMVESVIDLVGAERSLIRHVTDRPGHDRRYAVTTDRIRALDWEPSISLEAGLRDDVRWYQENVEWWHSATGEAYQSYYHRQYGERFAHDQPGSP